jgi:hypothetical protein
MMPTRSDRDRPWPAGSPAREPRTLDEALAGLERMAVAGSSGDVRRRLSGSATGLADDARAAARLTPAAVADWLGNWLPPEEAAAEDFAARERVVALLRRDL